MLDALDGPADQVRVVLFEGPGGIGKTRLLAEARQLCVGRPDLLCTDVLDLYLTSHQGQARLLLSIASQLQAAAEQQQLAGNHFASFSAALEHFYARMGESSEDQRQTLEQVFLQEYQSLADRVRLVLLLDTLEKLHPAIPEAAEFDFRELGRLEGWLAQLLARLPNTTVLMAGRPRERQRQLFAATLGAALTVVAVTPFTLEETTSYVKSEFAELIDFDQQQIEVLHTISAGRPVLLAIALACSQHEWIDLSALPAGFDAEALHYRETLSERFVALIVGDLFMRRPEIAQMLARAVYLRKGLRGGLLERIVASEDSHLSASELAAQLETFAQLVFVKRVGEHELMLHDELYELLLDKIGAQQTAIWWRTAISYLNEEIARTNELLQTRIGRLQDELELSANGSPLSYAKLQQRLQSLKIERLFYQLALNPQQGYQSYRELQSYAIAARDHDFDAQLQDELARFFEPHTKWGERYRAHLQLCNLTWERIVYEDGIRWISRRINAHVPGADSYMDAIRIAERVRERYRTIYDAYVLARCDLEAAQLQAEIYIAEKAPRGSQINANYQLLRDTLLEVIQTASTDDLDAAYARLILANAYNYWGYFERTHDRLESAITKYSEAILLYRQLGPEVESLQAVTLTNLGYALSRQGDSQRGLISLERALDLVTRTGIVYRVGITYNVQAQIFADLGQNERALHCVLEAQRLLARFDSLRAKALNGNAMGRIRSRIAESCGDPVQRDGEYDLADQAYREAIRAFDAEGELTRRVEVRAALARALRDWARDLEYRGEHCAAQRSESLAILAEAQTLTTSQTPQVLRCSLLEATASVLNDQGEYAQALALLDEARLLLPPNLRDPQGFYEAEATRELRIYWLRFAQIELQYALVAFGQARYEVGCTHLLRAFSGLFAFSPETAPIINFRELARRRLLKLNDAASVQALRQTTATAAAQMRVSAGAAILVDRLLEQVAQTISDRDLFGI
ncbi:hypothetical protein CJ255_16765 [Candidatus Viridilinea mediisalina]|uniref:NACHT domain-containing protein n=2 Tax=Candidatus Viridilinea mediisalina TaxID=2024553 RepID=A0A2A6RFK6_9CHLR|nr:hypothetical protein CJ255_16765 [Candidatus Viridilinea mediisalina]